ncbi:MAG: Holliday junction branch migration protein RuvA [Lachnospiraceae bacterium]|nr:Holliday junction branch migration protein RuvA [Lachnospiraceae bacterium]
MISYIKGILADVFSDRIIIENNGMGYEVLVPGSLTGRMPLIGEEVKLHTYLYVREDALMLYGFFSREDLEVFKLLLGVSGIGPKGALAVLAVLTPHDLRLAVAMEDAKMIATAPGIGLKTAKKLIIELKDKLKEPVESADPLVEGAASLSGAASGELSGKQTQQEAVEALVALGYGRSEAAAAVRKAGADADETADVEILLRHALKNLL